MERDGLPEETVAWGWTILIWGLTMELFASIGQMAIDGEIGNRQRSEIVSLEGVSEAQQSKIVDLDTLLLARTKELLAVRRLTADRSFTVDERQSVIKSLSAFPGQQAKIVIFPVNFESS
jgi:hypothetical protein